MQSSSGARPRGTANAKGHAEPKRPAGPSTKENVTPATDRKSPTGKPPPSVPSSSIPRPPAWTTPIPSTIAPHPTLLQRPPRVDPNSPSPASPTGSGLANQQPPTTPPHDTSSPPQLDQVIDSDIVTGGVLDSSVPHLEPLTTDPQPPHKAHPSYAWTCEVCGKTKRKLPNLSAMQAHLRTSRHRDAQLSRNTYEALIEGTESGCKLCGAAMSCPDCHALARTLHQNATDYFKAVAPTWSDRARRQAFLKYIEGILRQKWPNATLHMFGSSATDMYSKDSDIDMCMRLNSGDPALSPMDPGKGNATPRREAQDPSPVRPSPRTPPHTSPTPYPPTPTSDGTPRKYTRRILPLSPDTPTTTGDQPSTPVTPSDILDVSGASYDSDSLATPPPTSPPSPICFTSPTTPPTPTSPSHLFTSPTSPVTPGDASHGSVPATPDTPVTPLDLMGVNEADEAAAPDGSRTSAKDQEIALITEVGAHLRRHAGMKDLVVLTHTRVPIVKKQYPTRYGFKFDLCVERPLGMNNSSFLSHCTRMDPRLKPLALLVKAWAKAQGINNVQNGFVSSYCLICMLIYYLQTLTPAILPNLLGQADRLEPQMVAGYNCAWEMVPTFKSTNRSNLGRLLLGFFYFYGYQFDFENCVVSVRMGLFPPPRKMVWQHYGWDKDSPLCVEDPFETDFNIGRRIKDDTLLRMVEDFRIAYACLVKGRAVLAELWKPPI
eukprot:TRINITY_DN4809_c0_g1_i5.p1 TRINITY_DN4809_c0_g1~~TRINITY_DN4809_c0_g1_i5.p1  ORF type:complete len:717 (-),score=123.88 TRINITY_DN4809_c0_g1_i5:36-2186(-)